MFHEVVAILLQATTGVRVCSLGAGRDRREATDPEVDACCPVAGRYGCLDFARNQVQFPLPI